MKHVKFLLLSLPQATFHFKTFKTDEEKTQIDCSRDLGQPFELLIGKKFKLEVWEELIKTMREREVARFTCHRSLVGGYPIVSKSLRTVAKKAKGEITEEHNHHEHSCSLSAMKSTGYPDLDDLLVNEQDLIFEIELLKFEKPGEFTKETWQMDADEKLSIVPRLKEDGNKLYQAKKYKEAAEKYAKALGCLEQLCLREKPGDKPWRELDRMKIPFLLNYAQCKLFLGDFYEVIEHTSTVLEKDQDNIKALFRRAKAHVKCWNPKEAREDFNRVATLDPSLAKAVKKELDELDRLTKEHDAEDRNKLKSLFK